MLKREVHKGKMTISSRLVVNNNNNNNSNNSNNNNNNVLMGRGGEMEEASIRGKEIEEMIALSAGDIEYTT